MKRVEEEISLQFKEIPSEYQPVGQENEPLKQYF